MANGGEKLRAAWCEAQHLRVHRPRPMPWMRGLVGAALGHVSILPLAFRPLSLTGDVSLVHTTAVITRPPAIATVLREEPSASASVAPKRRRIGELLPDSDDVTFSTAVRQWSAFVRDTLGYENCTVGTDLLTEGRTEHIVEELRVIFASKPHSTLTKRLGALRMYARWCNDHGGAAFPLSEETVFGYLKFAATQTPTRGHGASSVLDGSRCKGATYVGLETKGEPVQARPLTVAMVGKLEAAVLSARDPRDRMVAGFVAFCVHARLRVGDALRISREPLIDLPSGTNDGFIEVSTHKHKTRARGSKRLLPIVALSNGIKFSGWAPERLAARCKIRMKAVSDNCLLRALSPSDGWETRRTSVAEVTAWIKAFFQNEAFTSRSLKPTVLGWAARHGMTRADRRTLGYHVKPKDRQVSIYSRDELSIPLRALAVLYADVRACHFLPDETSSRHWVPQSCCGSTSDESSSSRPSKELDRMDRAHSSESRCSSSSNI